MSESRALWPGFVTEPCADCGCRGDLHMPPCVGHVERKGRTEYCGCAAYRAVTPQQVSLIDTRPHHQEVTDVR